MSVENLIVRYECCLCVKEAIKGDLELNYVEITTRLLPIVIDIIGKFNSPAILFPMIDFLSNLFTKCTFTSQNQDIANAIKSNAMLSILKLDNELIMGAMCDMIKSLVATFPTGSQNSFGVGGVLTPIFTIALEYIDFHMAVKVFLLNKVLEKEMP